MTEVKFGILAPLVARFGKDDDVAEFLYAGHSIAQSEPETRQWFAVRYEDISPSTTFAIFDTFTSEAGRKAHLGGQIPIALSANAPKLLVPEPVDICQVEILASKVEKTASSSTKTAGLSVGARVLFEAKPEKVQAVRNFLINALSLINEESETPVWYAIHFPGTNKFGIVDFFTSDAERNVHAGGKVAKALFSSVDELLTGIPDVVKVDVLAVKISA